MSLRDLTVSLSNNFDAALKGPYLYHLPIGNMCTNWPSPMK